MTRRLLIVSVGIVMSTVAATAGWIRHGSAGTAPAASGARSTTTLPYYDSRDLTPRWAPVSHVIAPFSLVAQDGRPFTGNDLAGRVHIASFIYTRCAMVCPALVTSLKKVRDRVADARLLIVSYSVTPDIDTPGVLSAFGRERGLDAARWKLVTGNRSRIYQLARDSYFSSDERPAGPGDGSGLLHTEQVVLVDREGHLRGVYNGTQPADLDHLVEDARTLLQGASDK